MDATNLLGGLDTVCVSKDVMEIVKAGCHFSLINLQDVNACWNSGIYSSNTGCDVNRVTWMCRVVRTSGYDGFNAQEVREAGCRSCLPSTLTLSWGCTERAAPLFLSDRFSIDTFLSLSYSPAP